MNFSFRLRELRAEHGLSGEELGKKIGIGKSAISKLENGETTPRASTLIALSNYFNVSIDYLLGMTDIKQSMKDIKKDDFQIAFSNLQGELSEDDKELLKQMAERLINTKKDE